MNQATIGMGERSVRIQDVGAGGVAVIVDGRGQVIDWNALFAAAIGPEAVLSAAYRRLVEQTVTRHFGRASLDYIRACDSEDGRGYWLVTLYVRGAEGNWHAARTIGDVGTARTEGESIVAACRIGLGIIPRLATPEFSLDGTWRGCGYAKQKTGYQD